MLGGDYICWQCQLSAGSGDALEISSGVWDLPGEFPGNTPRSSARERARSLLDLLLSVLGDRARLAAGVAPESLAHGDLAERIAWSSAEGPRLISRLLDARRTRSVRRRTGSARPASWRPSRRRWR